VPAVVNAVREEIAKLPPNMRRPLDCPRGRRPIYVELDVGHQVSYRASLPPTGIAGDGPFPCVSAPPPGRAALPIFADNDSKPHTGTTFAVLTTLAQFQHSIAQFVAYYPRRWWRRRSNRDRGRNRRRTILRRNHNPRSVATLLVASLLVVTVAAGPRLALRSNGSTSGPADDRADCSPAPAAHCST
jgi:hypothetical protein